MSAFSSPNPTNLGGSARPTAGSRPLARWLIYPPEACSLVGVPRSERCFGARPTASAGGRAGAAAEAAEAAADDDDPYA